MKGMNFGKYKPTLAVLGKDFTSFAKKHILFVEQS